MVEVPQISEDNSPVYLLQKLVNGKVIQNPRPPPTFHLDTTEKPEKNMAAVVFMIGLPSIEKFGDHPHQLWGQWVADFERACRGYGMDEKRMRDAVYMYLEDKAAEDFRDMEWVERDSWGSPTDWKAFTEKFGEKCGASAVR